MMAVLNIACVIGGFTALVIAAVMYHSDGGPQRKSVALLLIGAGLLGVTMAQARNFEGSGFTILLVSVAIATLGLTVAFSGAREAPPLHAVPDPEPEKKAGEDA